MITGHRIERKEGIKTFLARISQYTDDQIECTDHTFFRLSEKQRKIFKCEEIRKIIRQTNPFLVGIQFNGNYAVFYKHEGNKVIRIMLDITPTKIEVVTFVVIDHHQVPKIK